MPTYRPKHYYMGAWKYVFLDLLYMIPLIGTIFLIAHCFSNANENRKHYARSYFARLIAVLVIIGLVLGICYLTMGSRSMSNMLNDLSDQWNEFIHIFTSPGKIPSQTAG